MMNKTTVTLLSLLLLSNYSTAVNAFNPYPPALQPQIQTKSSANDENGFHKFTLNQIREAMRAGNFAEAYYLWRPLAENGDAEAQYGIGWMYHNGYGLAIDDDKAIEWWSKAAAQGWTEADFSIGMLYHYGDGNIKKDTDKALEYYSKAALAGHEDAQLILKNMLAQGNAKVSAKIIELLKEHQDILGNVPVTVKVSLANTRSGPGTEHKVVTVVKQGQALMVLQKQGEWLQCLIVGTDQEAWIHSGLVDANIPDWKP